MIDYTKTKFYGQLNSKLAYDIITGVFIFPQGTNSEVKKLCAWQYLVKEPLEKKYDRVRRQLIENGLIIG
jgi:hypothetical protein